MSELLGRIVRGKVSDLNQVEGLGVSEGMSVHGPPEDVRGLDLYRRASPREKVSENKLSDPEKKHTYRWKTLKYLCPHYAKRPWE